MDPAFVISKLFLDRLAAFLDQFPKEFRLAIEIRNAELLNSNYLKLLNTHGITHCFNQWFSMPPIVEQMKLIASLGGLEFEYYYARLITPLQVKYDAAEKIFSPFYQLKKRDNSAREDILRLARRGLQRSVPTFVVVNNRFEGNSACTVLELEELLLCDKKIGK